MRVLCVFGQHNYGDPHRGEGIEYANFLPSLRRLGHEVSFLDSWDRRRAEDPRKLNETLLATVERERPEVVLTVIWQYEIWLETWEILRDSGISATVNWTTDDSWKYAQFSRLVAPAFHAFTTTYPDVHARYVRDGHDRVLLTQWAANAATLARPIPARECAYAVSFVGTAHGRRKRWIAGLARRGIHVECFGHGWPRGSVPAGLIPEIYRKSVISLNFANSAARGAGGVLGRANQIKARTFEIPGAGGFLLSEWSRGLDRYYKPGHEIGTFRGTDELAEGIRYYLTHPTERDRIAHGGHERTYDEHIYDRRLAEVIGFAIRQRDDFFARRGIAAGHAIDWKRFANAAAEHRVGWWHLAVRRVLARTCSYVWGPVRGPRAARRFVFELSWRLFGRWAYSAGGWPARLFPSQR